MTEEFPRGAITLQVIANRIVVSMFKGRTITGTCELTREQALGLRHMLSCVIADMNAGCDRIDSVQGLIDQLNGAQPNRTS